MLPSLERRIEILEDALASYSEQLSELHVKVSMSEMDKGGELMPRRLSRIINAVLRLVGKGR
jgi:hypothetical protein